LVFVLCLLVGSSGSIRAAGTNPKPAKSERAFNVLMIAVDDLRPMLGCYGDAYVQTPNIDRLATQGVVFERAYCQIAKCGPSRLSLLAGLRPDHTGVFDHRAADLQRFRRSHAEHVSLPGCFTNAGYYTQSFGKVAHDGWNVAADWSSPSMPGRDKEMMAVADLDAISKVPFEDRADIPTVIRPRDDCPAIQAPDVPDDAMFAGQMTAAAITTLREVKDRSFFLAVGYRRPHLPFVAPKRDFDLYQPRAEWLPAHREPPRGAPIMGYFNSDAYVGFARRVGLTMPDPPMSREQAVEWAGFELRSYRGVPYHGPIPDELQLRLRQAYMACVSYVDRQIGRLLDELQRLQLDRSTVVVLWSDHGWHLGEHASWGKMTNFELDTRVPLLFSVPGVKPSRTRSIVELIDLYPTLCDLCGLDQPTGLDGRSLVPALTGSSGLAAKPAFSQFTRFRKYMGRAIRTDRHRYVQWSRLADGAVTDRELYEHQTDPGETINLAGRPESAELVKELDARLPAKSPPLDPAGTWVETPWGQPVIDRGAAGAWDHYAVDNPYVHAEGEKFYCFFEAQDRPFSQGGHEAFGLAVSGDGRRWKKVGGNPILNVGKAGAWDSVVAKLPAGVIKRDGLYHLFYSGLDTSTKQIGLATARELTGPWTKASGNPVLKSRPGQWDSFLSTYPAPVFEVEGNYYLLFRGMETRYRRQGAGIAVSTDLRHWRRCSDRPIIPVTEEMASLAVTLAGGRYVGISQSTDLRQRRYWFSADLKHWQKGPPVNFRASVQPETLSNPFLVNGRWTVLYEQKDRIYRAVLQPAP